MKHLSLQVSAFLTATLIGFGQLYAEDKQQEKKRTDFTPTSKEEVKALNASDAWEMLLPSPSEILTSLEKLDLPGGKVTALAPLVSISETKKAASEEAQALLAGSKISDFFIVLMAKDENRSEKLVKDLINLANKLKASPSVHDNGEALVKAIKQTDWPKALTLVDKIYATLKADFEGDEDKKRLAKYLSLGAWSRSIYLMSKHLSKNYSKDASMILRQSFIADYFTGQFKSTKKAALNKKLRDSLKKISSATKVDKGQPISQDAIQNILKASKELLEAV